MASRDPNAPKSSEVTDEKVYLNRRAFMRAGVLAATTAATGYVYRRLNSAPSSIELPPQLPPELVGVVSPTTAPAVAGGTTTRPTVAANSGFTTDEKRTPIEDVTHYNNFYEFSTDKGAVAEAAAGFVARPWTVRVEGLVGKPKTFDIDEFLKIAPPEERIYRMRCVEGWSMVIPWDGFSLSKLLDRVEPLSSAKYVAFETLVDPKRMPNQTARVLDWPYVEGLRMDEAMHPLTILASGLYGRQLAPQNGAPLRLVVPWKYGFKGIKSIVRITLTDKEPPATWNAYAPSEYGFYANVNPAVDHPRWSQATEQRLGESGRRKTLPFNGYAEQVAHLYAGMDLTVNY